MSVWKGVGDQVISGVPNGRVGGFQTTPPPEIPKALQNRAELKPIVKNC